MVEFLNIETVIRRCAAIEDELESIGANKLLKEREELKKTTKTFLINENSEKESFYDEVSNWEAVLSIRTKDEWDVEVLRGYLSEKQWTRYVSEQVDKEAIKAGIKNGDLSRATLESKGAVEKVPYSYALYVREKKTE